MRRLNFIQMKKKADLWKPIAKWTLAKRFSLSEPFVRFLWSDSANLTVSIAWLGNSDHGFRFRFFCWDFYFELFWSGVPSDFPKTISNIKNIFPNRSITPLPCPKCVDVIFCSKKCRNASIYSYHKFECGLLETFWSSGSSINYQMAMRLVSQRPMSYYKSIRDDLKDSLSLEELKQWVKIQNWKLWTE